MKLSQITETFLNHSLTQAPSCGGQIDNQRVVNTDDNKAKKPGEVLSCCFDKSTVEATKRLRGTKQLAQLSLIKMQYVYQWLISYNMEDRGKRITPPSKCFFLVDFLTSAKRQEFEEQGALDWRDWNVVYRRIKDFRWRDGEMEHWSTGALELQRSNAPLNHSIH